MTDTNDKQEPQVAIKKSRDESIIVRLSEYKGRPFVDMRIWFIDRDNVLRPTRKGITFRPSDAEEIKRAIDTVLKDLPKPESGESK